MATFLKLSPQKKLLPKLILSFLRSKANRATKKYQKRHFHAFPESLAGLNRFEKQAFSLLTPQIVLN